MQLVLIRRRDRRVWETCPPPTDRPRGRARSPVLVEDRDSLCISGSWSRRSAPATCRWGPRWSAHWRDLRRGWVRWTSPRLTCSRWGWLSPPRVSQQAGSRPGSRAGVELPLHWQWLWSGHSHRRHWGLGPPAPAWRGEPTISTSCLVNVENGDNNTTVVLCLIYHSSGPAPFYE